MVEVRSRRKDALGQPRRGLYVAYFIPKKGVVHTIEENSGKVLNGSGLQPGALSGLSLEKGFLTRGKITPFEDFTAVFELE